MKVKRVVPHPNYNFGITHDNDIALFQLSVRVRFHEHLSPVCLPPANMELLPGTVCTVIGWGKKEDTGSKIMKQCPLVQIVNHFVFILIIQCRSTNQKLTK